MKEYPPRSQNTYKFGVCECTHAYFDHTTNFFSDGNCEKCMCPKYKKETTMSHDEYYEFRKTIVASGHGERDE